MDSLIRQPLQRGVHVPGTRRREEAAEGQEIARGVPGQNSERITGEDSENMSSVPGVAVKLAL